jgi:protoporphyrinogen oxidase
LTSRTKTVGIVGGGILGMTLALRLAQRGFKVTILEASDRLGGLAAPTKIGPYTWDRFYHVILMSDSHLLALLEELDLADQIHWCKAKTGFYTDGRLYSMSNIFEFLSFPPLTLLDKLRLGWTIFYASKIKSWQRLEKVSVEEWLTRHSGKRTFKKIWLPLLKSKLGENYRITNAAFIWATIDRMYAARRSGLKQEMFGYVNGGYSTILDRFQAHLGEIGVETLAGFKINKISNNGARVEIKSESPTDAKFDSLILTTPSTQLLDFCQQFSSHEKNRLRKLEYEGVICLALILKKPLAEYYVTNITEERIPFTAVIEMTSLVDNACFDGNSLIYLPLYLDNNDPFWKKSDKEVEDEFLGALQSMHQSFREEDVLFSRISRANHVMPITTKNYTAELLPPTTTSVPNLFIVNSAQIPNGTMNVNEIVGLAKRKAKEIARYLEA